MPHNLLLTDEEWRSLSAESRHKLNVLIDKVYMLVGETAGMNHRWAKAKLIEMGLENADATP